MLVARIFYYIRWNINLIRLHGIILSLEFSLYNIDYMIWSLWYKAYSMAKMD